MQQHAADEDWDQEQQQQQTMTVMMVMMKTRMKTRTRIRTRIRRTLAKNNRECPQHSKDNEDKKTGMMRKMEWQQWQWRKQGEMTRMTWMLGMGTMATGQLSTNHNKKRTMARNEKDSNHH
jgi:hypothetical protein